MITIFDEHHHFRFSLVIWSFYGLMRVTALHSMAFRDKLKDRDMALTMTTQSADIPRTFRFYSGKVGYIKGETQDSSVRLIWTSPETGERIMMKMAKGHSRALMKAVISGDLKLEGDAAGIKWFLDLTTLLAKTYRKKR
jgi:hypothetical protein